MDGAGTDAALVAGLDCGGTHTTAAVATLSGRVLACGHGGPANVCTHPDTAADSVRSALAAALARAGRRRDEVAAASLGVAGFFACNLPGGPDALIPGLLSPGARAEVVPDIDIALAGAVGDEGVVLISGTGSVAYGGTRDGARTRAGGWGYLLSDEGSAFWIGLQAVRAALRAYDGRGAPTALTGHLLKALGKSAASELEGAVYGMAPINTGVAALAAVVPDAAAQGDPVAAAILDDAGRLLTEMVVAVLERLGRRSAALPVATVGGVLQEHGAVRRALARELAGQAPSAELIVPDLPPVGGALLRAMALGGAAPDAGARRRLRESLSRADAA